MYTSETDRLPKQAETLAEYIQRLRTVAGLSQRELAQRAGIHPQSIGKIERGQTARLNHKPKAGIALALGIPTEYLDAACKGIPVAAISSLKLCPHCWIPGTPPEPIWTHVCAHYCYICGTGLRDRCLRCDKPITSYEFRFCPYCGKSFKSDTENT